MTDQNGADLPTVQLRENFAVLRHRVDRLEELTPKILRMEKEILVITEKLESQTERLTGIAEDCSEVRNDISDLTRHIDRAMWIGAGIFVTASFITGMGAAGWQSMLRIFTG